MTIPDGGGWGCPGLCHIYSIFIIHNYIFIIIYRDGSVVIVAEKAKRCVSCTGAA